MATLPESSVDDQCNPVHFEGYDDAMFVDPPDQASDLLCPVCILVLRDPHLLSCCGKHLCKICLERVETVDNACPCCNGENFNKMLNKEKKGVILGLKVYCSNRGNGCTWTGELGDMDRHLGMKCDYALEACPYGCDQRVLRHAILNHTERECTKRPLEVQLKCLSRDMEEKLRAAIEMKYEEKVAVLERNNTALEAMMKKQEKKFNKQQAVLERKIEEMSATLETTLKNQEKKSANKQKKSEQRLVALEDSSTLYNSNLKKMEKRLKDLDVQSELSCEVTVPVTLGKMEYLKRSRAQYESIFKRNDDVLVSEGRDGPTPVIKLCNATLDQKLAKAQSEISKIVSSVETETFWFPHEKEEIFRYLFSDDDNWKKILNSDSVMMCFIQNKKPFTIEICGRTRNEVMSAVNELERFRDNSPFMVEVQLEHHKFDKVRSYAKSKSVKLITLHPTRGHIKSNTKTYNLRGGKYDIQLVLDFTRRVDDDDDDDSDDDEDDSDSDSDDQ